MEGGNERDQDGAGTAMEGAQRAVQGGAGGGQTRNDGRELDWLAEGGRIGREFFIALFGPVGLWCRRGNLGGAGFGELRDHGRCAHGVGECLGSCFWVEE